MESWELTFQTRAEKEGRVGAPPRGQEAGEEGRHTACCRIQKRRGLPLGANAQQCLQLFNVCNPRTGKGPVKLAKQFFVSHREAIFGGVWREGVGTPPSLVAG